MLGSILCVTSTTANLDRAIDAYVSALAYRVADRGHVSFAQAEAWAAPLCAGRPMALLAPGEGERVFLRLIENPNAIHVPAHASLGWNVTEFNVGAVDDLCRNLTGGPFRHVAGPETLSMNADIRAMQATGPDGELVYFTQIDPTPRTAHLPTRESGVGRVFIMVLGVPDLACAARQFRDDLGCAVTPPIRFKSPLIANPLGLDADHAFSMGLVRLPGKFTLEVDELGADAPPRVVAPGDLPPGIAMVSFAVTNQEGSALMERQPTYVPHPIFGDCRAAWITGPGGARFELIARR